MTMVSSKALLHPIRLQIAQVLLVAERCSTKELHAQLPDIPIASLYRHVAYLAKDGLIEAVDERPVGGASEKVYALAAGLANPSLQEFTDMPTEDLLTVFTVFVSGLIRDFREYLQRDGYDLDSDRVGFAQAAFWASDDEVDALGEELTALLSRMATNPPGDGRRRRVLSTILMPNENPEGHGQARGSTGRNAVHEENLGSKVEPTSTSKTESDR